MLTIRNTPTTNASSVRILARKEYSLADRYNNSFVNSVFSDNILLTLAYMTNVATQNEKVNWEKVDGNFTYKLVLQPNQTFAFHDQVLKQYKGKIAETTNAHFDSSEGFKSDGWLVGDGVCHLASFMNVVAQQAKLSVVAPTPHNFEKIADVPKQYGVSIYYMPGNPTSSGLQNLYITNPYNKPIVFVFNHKNNELKISIEKLG